MSRLKQCDLLFIRVLFILVHIGLMYAFCHVFYSLLWQYQTYDEAIRAMLYDPGLECTNISLVIDHILTQKHETAKQLLMHITYVTAIFVAMVVMLSRNFALILGYTLFFVAVLGANLFVPIITPYLSMALFLTSTMLGLTYVCVYLCGPKHLAQPKRKLMTHSRATTGLGRSSGRTQPPQVPPFPDDI